MAILTDIGEAWLHPRRVMRRKLTHNKREDQGLAFLMIACAVIFIGQIPAFKTSASDTAEFGNVARMAASLFAWLFVVPLFMYFVAALSHVLARLVGGAGDWLDARLALFWAIFAAAPVWFLSGLATSTISPGVITKTLAALAFAGFIVIWMASLFEAEHKEPNL